MIHSVTLERTKRPSKSTNKKLAMTASLHGSASIGGAVEESNVHGCKLSGNCLPARGPKPAEAKSLHRVHQAEGEKKKLER